MSLKKNLIANYLGQGWSGLIGLAFVPLYIKYLGVEAYGLIGFYAMLQAWLALLDMGMTPTLNREVARFTAGAHSAAAIRDLVRTFEIVCGAMASLTAASMFAASDWIANHWLNARTIPAADVARALSLMGVASALLFVEGLYKGGLLGFQKHVWLNAVAAIVATARAAGAVIVLAWGWPTIQAFFVWQIAVSVASVGALCWGLRRNLPAIARRPKFTMGAFSAARKFAGGMFATTLLALLLMQVDKLLLSRLLSLEGFGTYMFAVTVTGALTLLILATGQSYYPRLTELVARGDEAALAKVYHQGAQLMAILLVPAGLVLVAFSEPLLLAWSHDGALAATVSPLIAVLALGTILNGLTYMPYMLQLAYGWPSLSVWTNAIAVTISLPMLFVVAPRFGAIGAAWLWFALNAGYFLFSVPIMHTRLLRGQLAAWYIRDTLLPSFAAAGVIALAAMLKPSFSGLWAEIIWISLAAGVACTAVVLASSVFRGHLLRMLRQPTRVFR